MGEKEDSVFANMTWSDWVGIAIIVAGVITMLVDFATNRDGQKNVAMIGFWVIVVGFCFLLGYRALCQPRRQRLVRVARGDRNSSSTPAIPLKTNPSNSEVLP